MQLYVDHIAWHKVEKYCTNIIRHKTLAVENFWWIAANKHFGRQNIGGLAANQLQLVDRTLVNWSRSTKSTKLFYYQSFVPYSNLSIFWNVHIAISQTAPASIIKQLLASFTKSIKCVLAKFQIPVVPKPNIHHWIYPLPENTQLYEIANSNIQ